MNRPEGALTPAELEALLDKHGRVKIYMCPPRRIWRYFTKYHDTRYTVINDEGKECDLDWNGVRYGMDNWLDHHIFTNYWLYYGYMLRQGQHEQLLP